MGRKVPEITAELKATTAELKLATSALETVNLHTSMYHSFAAQLYHLFAAKVHHYSLEAKFLS